MSPLDFIPVSSLLAVTPERIEGIEPSPRPWQGHALPLCYKRMEQPSDNIFGELPPGCKGHQGCSYRLLDGFLLI